MTVTIDTITHNMRKMHTGEGPVKQAVITIPDGDVDTDITVVTPAEGRCIFIVGLLFSENNAMNFKIKYSDTSYFNFELAENQGVFMPVGSNIIPLQQDIPLIIKSDAGVTDLSIFYIEALSLTFHQ